MAGRARANCLGNKVGAVLVVGNQVVAAGYNGTPEDMKNCDEGGCDRCLNREKYGSGTGYDVCICVHAEQNALLSAARFGITVEGAILYSTMRPCFGCTKELLQAKVNAIYYLHDWQHPDAGLNAQYELLQGRFLEGIRRLEIQDPDVDWAGEALGYPSAPPSFLFHDLAAEDITIKSTDVVPISSRNGDRRCDSNDCLCHERASWTDLSMTELIDCLFYLCHVRACPGSLIK
jgi:dCMP deaminase